MSVVVNMAAAAIYPSPCKGEAGWGSIMDRYTRKPEHTARARRLRRDMTPMEKKLWGKLRNEQMGVSFRRQHPVGVYVVDFAAPSVGLVIELDGGQHGTEERQAYDAARTHFLEDKGFTVIRFWNNEVFENFDGVLETTWLKVQELKARIGSGEDLSGQALPVSPPARGRLGGGQVSPPQPQGTPTPTLPLAGGGSEGALPAGEVER